MQHMGYHAMIGVVGGLVLLTSGTAAAWAQEAKEEPRLIATQATREEHVAPDSVTLSLEVVTQAETVAQARKDNAERMAKMLETIKGHNWKELVTQTSQFSVEPIYERQRGELQMLPKVLGFRVRNTLVVTMEQLEKEALAERATMLFDEGMQHGANQVNGPFFYVKDPERIQMRLLADAVTEAKQRAQIMADAAGVQLLRLHHLEDQPSGFRPMQAMRSLAMVERQEADVATPIEVGEQTVSVTVSLSYEVGETIR